MFDSESFQARAAHCLRRAQNAKNESAKRTWTMLAQQAWQNRLADPRTYERTISKLAIEFGEKFRRFEPEPEIDHAAVVAAVRHQGGKVPPEPPPDFSRMSDRELQRWKDENMR